jgi:transposase
LLPNKPRGVPRVDDWQVSERHLLGAAVRCAVARPAGARWAKDDVLQPLRAVATGEGVRSTEDIQMIDGTSIRAHQQAATAKKGAEIIVSVPPEATSRPKSTRSSIGKDYRSARSRHGADAPAAPALLDRLEPRTIVLADKAYDGNAIRGLIEGQGGAQHGA